MLYITSLILLYNGKCVPFGHIYLSIYLSIYLFIPSHHTQPLVTASLISFVTSLVFFCILDFTSEIIKYLSAFVWLISLRTMPSRSPNIVSYGRISSLLWMANSALCICHIFLILPFISGHLACVCVLTIVNNAPMNMGIQVTFWFSVLFALHILTEVEMLNHSIVLFLNFWESFTVFRSGCTNLKSHQ